MSKFKPMELIGEMHGKFHSKSEYYAAERYGTQYTGKIGESAVPPTPAQIAQRERFAQVQTNIAALTSEQKVAYATAFRKSPGKYRSLQGYIFAQEYAKLGS